jgi:hypothetical protein
MRDTSACGIAWHSWRNTNWIRKYILLQSN